MIKVGDIVFRKFGFMSNHLEPMLVTVIVDRNYFEVLCIDGDTEVINVNAVLI